MIEALVEYVIAHSERGDCACGKCFDAPANPKQPIGHTANVHFFRVAKKGEPTAEQLRELIVASRHGEFADVDPLDGQEHSYIELGGWIGDQGLALSLMGLGQLVGLWKIRTPWSMLALSDGNAADRTLADQLAGAGYVTVQAPATTEEAR